ncbi:hypothetical protein CBR_g30581 [Chara braunii]|uniref:Reverse transcriptase domain-containing protein n=1 Tax=Chara braunii TaxID=69332 RepID=A0A388LD36_CHABU|nr:hypothetical protein CBR_g30581 [Chara braunii]|eukprot:GBG80214.1 hypothetical protein CBR_g30581 [Chara braunii]
MSIAVELAAPSTSFSRAAPHRPDRQDHGVRRRRDHSFITGASRREGTADCGSICSDPRLGPGSDGMAGGEGEEVRSVMWFRKGLRLHDNPALHAACENATHVCPLFILDPWFLAPDTTAPSLGSARVGINRIQFLLESLEDLDRNLRSRGSRLLIVHGKPTEVFPVILEKWGITRLCFERDTEPYALQRDREVKEIAASAGVKVTSPVSNTLATSAVPRQQQCHVSSSAMSATVPRQQCHVSNSATSAVPRQQQCHISSATSTVPRQQCHVSNMTGPTLGMPGQLANESIADYKQRFQTQLALIEAEEQHLLAAEAARLQAEAATTTEKQRLQAEADADTQARRKEAQDLLQRHKTTSIERLKFWHFEPSEEHDDATPEEQHKEFMAKLMTRLVYTCNHLQSELANLQRGVRNHKAQHEDAARALDSRVQDLEQVAPRPEAGESSSAPSARQLEERVDHVVAMLGDISTFAAPATISQQLDTLKTNIRQRQQSSDLDRSTSTTNHYKMPTFRIEKFDDYTHQDPVVWWQGFTTELGIHEVPEHLFIGALFLNAKGGCQIWLSHMATVHGVQVFDLHKKVSWEDLTKERKKRFIVADAPTLDINRIFTKAQGNTTTRNWLTDWQKIEATPDLELPFPHLRREFYNRSCAALSLTLGDHEQYNTFAEIINKAREIIKTNRATAHEKSAWQPTYVEKVKTGPRPQQFATVQTDNIVEDPAATQASREGDQVAAVQPRSNNKSRGNEKAKTASPAVNGQPAPWVKFHLTEVEYKYRRSSPPSTAGDSTSWSRLEELDLLTFADFQWMPLPRSSRLPKPHGNELMAQLRDYLHTAVPTPLMDAGVEVVDLHANIAKIDREFKTQRYDDIDAPLLYVRIQIGEATCSALIDCGASRNYMSQDFMVRAGLGPRVRRKSQPTQVTLADGYTHKSIDRCIDDVPVYFAPHASKAVSLDILDTKFDMILGMSWLRSEDHPVNFYRRTVPVRDRNGVLVPCTVAPPHPSISCHVVSAASMRASIIRDDIEEMGVCFLHTLLPHDASPTDSSSDPRITELLDAYGDVFEGPHGVVPDRPIRHEIILEDGAVPPRGCIYRMRREELSMLRAQLDDLLEKGWIWPSSSPYGAPVLFVRKKNKDLRLCIDYRKLNAQMIRNAGPLPRIEDLLGRLSGAKFFSKLDLKSGYHQLEIRQEDRYKTVFKTRYGHFEWLVMPFGLTNAPTTFQAAMTTEFRHLLDRFVLIYLDDILVYSWSLDEHVEHRRTVLERLRQAKYKANCDKCEFARQELEYLGHYVTPQGIRPLADKIEALHVWPEPTNTTNVRSFMGLAGYYQRFITGYSRIAAPMTRLQSPKVPFVFDDDARRLFQALKTTMLMAPVLSIYDPILPTRVTTDASDYGIGAVLEQHDGDDWHPVEYFSHKVPPINSLDDARKKELLAFTWVTDNNPLTYYKTQDTVSSTIGRWMYFIDQFDFTPKHLPGLSNRAADALSRRPDLCAMTHHAFAFDEELQRHFIRGYESDPDFATLCAQLSSDHPPASHYRIADGYLLLHSRGKDLLCVPRDRRLWTRLLGEYHDSRLAGHFGVNRTIARLRQRFRWPDLVTDVTQYCDSCEVCRRSKPRNRNPYDELRPMPIPQEPGLSIAMDVTEPFPRDRLGHDDILTVVDRLSDLVWVSAEEFALEQDVSRKLLPKWFGPWSVTGAAGDEPDGPSFVINIPTHLMVHPVFHASKLATYTPAKSDDIPGRRSQDPPSMDGHQEVDRVITDCKYGSKPRQYKAGGRPPLTYQSFLKLAGKPPPPIGDAPAKIPLPPLDLGNELAVIGVPDIRDLGYGTPELLSLQGERSPFKGGETAGLERLEHYMAKKVEEEYNKNPDSFKEALKQAELQTYKRRAKAQPVNKRQLHEGGKAGEKESGLKRRRVEGPAGERDNNKPGADNEGEEMDFDAAGEQADDEADPKPESSPVEEDEHEREEQSLAWIRHYVEKAKREREHAFDVQVACLKHAVRSQANGKKNVIAGISNSPNQFAALLKVKAEEFSEYAAFRYAEKKRAREQGTEDKDKTIPATKDISQDRRPKTRKTSKNQKKRESNEEQGGEEDKPERDLLEKEIAVVLSQIEKLRKWNREYAPEYTTIAQIAKGKAPMVVEAANAARKTLRNIRPLIAARYDPKVKEWLVATDVAFQIPYFVEGENIVKALRNHVTFDVPLSLFETVALESDMEDIESQEGSESDPKTKELAGRKSLRAFSPLIAKMPEETQLHSGMRWRPWRTVVEVPYSILAGPRVSTELMVTSVASIVEAGQLDGDEELDMRAYALDDERFYRSEGLEGDARDGDDEWEKMDRLMDLEKKGKGEVDTEGRGGEELGKAISEGSSDAVLQDDKGGQEEREDGLGADISSPPPT